ncbi:MAG: protein kinase [Polyangiaceae bacterium]|nr:protein kinase [Polyangiaceae bacterium]
MDQSSAELQALVGRELGAYRLTGVVGRGSSALIFRAENVVQPQIRRALKVVYPELMEYTDIAAQLMREAAVHESLHHPNVVRFYGVRMEGRYLVMELELLEGKSLAELLEEHRASGTPLDSARAVRIIAEAARGVSAAHARGIIHRDLKPPNVFLCDSGAVKVLDFGIAKATEDALTTSKRVTELGTTPGSPGYVAPELLRGLTPTPASDVYSLGICLYEAFAGHHPLRPPGANPPLMELLQSVLRDDIPPLVTVAPSMPSAVTAIVTRATALQPEARYADAGALAGELDRVTAHYDVASVAAPANVDATRFALPIMGAPQGPASPDERLNGAANAPRRDGGSGVLGVVLVAVVGLGVLFSVGLGVFATAFASRETSTPPRPPGQRAQALAHEPAPLPAPLQTSEPLAPPSASCTDCGRPGTECREDPDGTPKCRLRPAARWRVQPWAVHSRTTVGPHPGLCVSSGTQWACESRGYRSGSTIYFYSNPGLIVTTEDIERRGLDIRLVLSRNQNVNVMQKSVSLLAGSKLFIGGIRYSLPHAEYTAGVLKLEYAGE